MEALGNTNTAPGVTEVWEANWSPLLKVVGVTTTSPPHASSFSSRNQPRRELPVSPTVISLLLIVVDVFDVTLVDVCSVPRRLSPRAITEERDDWLFRMSVIEDVGLG